MDWGRGRPLRRRRDASTAGRERSDRPRSTASEVAGAVGGFPRESSVPGPRFRHFTRLPPVGPQRFQRRRARLFPCTGVPRLLVEKFCGDEVPVHDELPVAVEPDAPEVRLRVGEEDRTLTRPQAAALRDALADALTERRSYLHTACEHREDGAYVVERAGAESAGHRKVFDCFEQCRRLYERLPAEFGADDVQHAGVTAGRRHMLVWHFVECPAFDCELVGRQPLTARKAEPRPGD